MGTPQERTRPLVSGLHIQSATWVLSSPEDIHNGTLTGLATRREDRSKQVLVACKASRT